MHWLGVHCPDLPLEAFTLREPVQPDPAQTGAAAEPLPRIVIEGNRVVLADTAATAVGIAVGSTLATAHAVCPLLRHYRRDCGQETRRLQRLAEALYALSSQVSVAPPAGIVVEIGASLRLFGGAAAVLERARAICQTLGHRVVCRTAPTPLAALALARAGQSALAEVPLAAAATGSETPFVPAVIEQLASMGVRTLGQLLALPVAGLADRFGQALVDYLQRLTGARPDPRRSLEPTPHFRRHLHLLAPVRSKDVLLGFMARLLNELQHWLIARELGVEQLAWRFAAAGRGRPPVALGVRFSTAQQRQARLLEICRLELDRATLPEEVIAIDLCAERLRSWRADTHGLFRWLPGSTRPAELGRLVDQLEARLGRGACWSVRTRDQHTPEAAWQPVMPLCAGTAMRPGRLPPRTAAPLLRPGLRPIWLFVPPRAVRSSQLTLLRGPERIETGWWLPADAAPPGAADAATVPLARTRDYYVARHVSGAECWVFVDARSRWYLHGYFG